MKLWILEAMEESSLLRNTLLLKKSYTIKWWRHLDLPMKMNVLRRLVGTLMVLAAIAYLLAWHFEYDLPKYDLPEQIRTPGFIIGYLSVLIFCFWPVEEPYYGNSQEVNLLPDKQPSFQQSLVSSNNPVPEQHNWVNGPMQHQGAWVASKADGSWWMYVNGNWERYA